MNWLKPEYFRYAPEQDEQEDIGGAYPDSHPEDSLASPDHVAEDPFQAEAHVSQVAGDEAAEEVVEQENQSQIHQGPARPSPRFEDDRKENERDDQIGLVQIPARLATVV